MNLIQIQKNTPQKKNPKEKMQQSNNNKNLILNPNSQNSKNEITPQNFQNIIKNENGKAC